MQVQNDGRHRWTVRRKTSRSDRRPVRLRLRVTRKTYLVVYFLGSEGRVVLYCMHASQVPRATEVVLPRHVQGSDERPPSPASRFDGRRVCTPPWAKHGREPPLAAAAAARRTTRCERAVGAYLSSLRVDRTSLCPSHTSTTCLFSNVPEVHRFVFHPNFHFSSEFLKRYSYRLPVLDCDTLYTRT